MVATVVNVKQHQQSTNQNSENYTCALSAKNTVYNINVPIIWNLQFSSINYCTPHTHTAFNNCYLSSLSARNLVCRCSSNNVILKRFAHFRFKLLRSTKPKRASPFCEWPLWGSRLVDMTASSRWLAKTKTGFKPNCRAQLTQNQKQTPLVRAEVYLKVDSY